MYTQFPARAPESAAVIANDTMRYGSAEPGEGWSAGQQAGMQAASLGLSFGMAIVGGTITGGWLLGVYLRGGIEGDGR